MLGGLVTAMSTSERAAMLAGAVAFVILAMYVWRLIKKLEAANDHIADLESTVTTLRFADAGLRSRMASTLRAPLASIVGFTDRLIADPTMDVNERSALLTEIRGDAREVERVLADLAETEAGSATPKGERVEGVVLLDEEVRSIASTTPPGITFETDLQQSRAWGDSASVRQVLRAVIAAARRNGAETLVLKTHELSKTATVTIASQGSLLGLEAIAALTGNTSSEDLETDSYRSLREAAEMAADMGGSIGYVETFGHAHVVVELRAAPKTLELQSLPPRKRQSDAAKPATPATGDSVPDLSFTAISDLRPERPSAAVRVGR